MTFGRDELALAAVSGFHILNEAAPATRPLAIDGIEGRITRVSHPFPNMVTLARLDEATADQAISRVIDRYAAEQAAFSWVIGPDSTPADLPARLESAGLAKVEVWSGLALTDLERVPELTVDVEEVDVAQLRRSADAMAMAFGFDLDEDVLQLMLDIVEALRAHYPSRTYAATDDGDLIGFAIMTGTPFPSVMNLALAATVPKHRRRGVYRSLVARRIVDARAAGAQAIVTQANRESSAPILRRLGFDEVCVMDMYAWLPPADA